MTEFLQSLKSDLLSRRLLPLVALLAVALIAAVGYALTGGSPSSSPTPSGVVQSAPGPGAATTLPVSIAPSNPNQAVSETPAGSRYQSHGPTRDPFIPLPEPPKAQSASAATSSSSSSKSTGSGSGGSSSGKTGSSGGSSPGGKEAPAPAPKKPAKPQFPYIVSVLFGRASTTPGQPATLTPYENIKLLQAFPSKRNTLIAFERVTGNGDGAVFKLVVPPILRGSGICLPSTSECQTIDVQVGHAEELEYIEASGQPVLYELKVVSIVKKSDGASTARAKRGAKTAQARFKVKAAQGIGQASAVRAVSVVLVPGPA
ncbi:MAG: hypothetical protein WA484_04080 [Solirubrobacteraceae bacterium]